MNFRKYVSLLGVAVLCVSFFAACGDDTEEGKIEPLASSFYVLNRGNFQANNASISYYDVTKNTLNEKFYEDANGSGLGDSAEDILVYGSKIYVTVTSSNRLAILDMDGKLLKSIEPEYETGDPKNPRYMRALDGKVYVSYYYGHSVAVLDTTSLDIENEIKVGRYPEQIAIANNKLYVANSGGLDTNYGETVSVMDIPTLTVEKDIKVVVNPNRLAVNSKGDVFVISMGNYGDIPNTLQRIDGATGEVTKLGEGTYMDIVKDKIYVLYAPYYTPEQTCVAKYDALTSKLESADLIPALNKVNTLSGIRVEPTSGQIYVMNSPYTETGSLSVYNSAGSPIVEKMDTKGYSPNALWFVGK